MIPYHGYDLATAAAAYGHHHHHPHHHTDMENHGPRIIFKMPKVVPNQREKFESDELFKRNSREAEIRFTLHRDRPLHERQAKFQAGCRDGHIEIANSSTGLVLLLTWNPMHNGNYYGVPRDGIDYTKEPGKVHIRSSLIINGVCCRFKGWIDCERLDGIGAIEFDEEMAEIENGILLQQTKLYNHRLKDLEQQHRIQQQHIKKIHQ